MWNTVGSLDTVNALIEGERDKIGIFFDLVSGAGVSDLDAVRALRDAGLVANTFVGYANFLFNEAKIGQERMVNVLKQAGASESTVLNILFSLGLSGGGGFDWWPFD